MTSLRHDFEQAFTELISSVQEQVKNDGIISFSDEISRPFRCSLVPTNSQVLQPLGKIFERERGLLLRFDGPAIYLIVSTVLQFPPSSILVKTTYFFMDTLTIYKDKTKATQALRSHIDASEIDQEVNERQKCIFSPLLRRLRELLADEGKDRKIRRLTAQLIMSLCLDNPRGWKGLMKGKTCPSFGRLFRQSNDYVLRTLVADIIRHLRAQNFDMHEIWDQTDEEAMDFPNSQRIQSADLEKLLDVMSGMDLKRAAVQGTSRIYRVRDINIPNRQFHIGRYNAILVLDDNITVLAPDFDTGNTVLRLIEFLVDENLVVENTPDNARSTALRISWKQDKGYWLFRGKKSAVTEIRLELTDDTAQADFVQAVCDVQSRAINGTIPIHTSQNVTVELEAAKCSLFMEESSSEEDDHKVRKNHKRCGTRPPSNFIQRAPTKPRRSPKQSRNDEMNEGPSASEIRSIHSDSLIGQVALSSDVFAAQLDKLETLDSGVSQEGKPLKNALKKQLLSSQATDLTEPLDAGTPELSSDLDSFPLPLSSSSPLKKLGKRKREESFALLNTSVNVSQRSSNADPTLSMPLDVNGDSDYASFQNTCSQEKSSTTWKGRTRSARHEITSAKNIASATSVKIPTSKRGKLGSFAADPGADYVSAVPYPNIQQPTSLSSRARKMDRGKVIQQNAGLSKNAPVNNASATLNVVGPNIITESISNLKKTSAHTSHNERIAAEKNTDCDVDSKTESKRVSKQSSRSVHKSLTNTTRQKHSPSQVKAKPQAGRVAKSETSTSLQKQSSAAVKTRTSLRRVTRNIKIHVQSSDCEDINSNEERLRTGTECSARASTRQTRIQTSSSRRLDHQQASSHVTSSLPNPDNIKARGNTPMSTNGHDNAAGASNQNSIDSESAESHSTIHKNRLRTEQFETKRTTGEPKSYVGGDVNHPQASGKTRDENDEHVEDSYPNQQPNISTIAHNAPSFGNMLNNLVSNIAREREASNGDQNARDVLEGAERQEDITYSNADVAVPTLREAARKHQPQNQGQVCNSLKSPKHDKPPNSCAPTVGIRQNKMSKHDHLSYQKPSLHNQISTLAGASRKSSIGTNKPHNVPIMSSKSTIIHFGTAGPSNQGVSVEAGGVTTIATEQRLQSEQHHPTHLPRALNAPNTRLTAHKRQQQRRCESVDLQDSVDTALDFDSVEEPHNKQPATEICEVHAIHVHSLQSANPTKDVSQQYQKTLKSGTDTWEGRMTRSAQNPAGMVNYFATPGKNLQTVQKSGLTKLERDQDNRLQCSADESSAFGRFRGERASNGSDDVAVAPAISPKLLGKHDASINDLKHSTAHANMSVGTHQHPLLSLSEGVEVTDAPPSGYTKRKSLQSDDSQKMPILISSTDEMSEQELTSDALNADRAHDYIEQKHPKYHPYLQTLHSFQDSRMVFQTENLTNQQREKNVVNGITSFSKLCARRQQQFDVSRTRKDECSQAANATLYSRASTDSPPSKCPSTNEQFANKLSSISPLKPVSAACQSRGFQPQSERSTVELPYSRTDAKTARRILPTKFTPLQNADTSSSARLGKEHCQPHKDSVEDMDNETSTAKRQRQKYEADESKKIQKPTSNIKRVRHFPILDSIKSAELAPITSTPQPFYERLLAHTSPPSNARCSDADDNKVASKERPASGDTTLVEPLFPFRRYTCHSSSLSSTHGSNVSVSSAPDCEAAPSKTACVSHRGRPQSTNRFIQDIQKTLAAIIKDVFIRVEQEDRMTRDLVQQYHDGCTQVLHDLEKNATLRTNHDATKLQSKVNDIQVTLRNAREQISKPLSEGGQLADLSSSPDSNGPQDYHERLLTMLTKVVL